MDRTQAIVNDVKQQVLAELAHSESQSHSHSSWSHRKGFQAYCQLVDAVREEVLLDLKASGSSMSLHDRQLVDTIKQDVLNQLRDQAIQTPYNPGTDS